MKQIQRFIWFFFFFRAKLLESSIQSEGYYSIMLKNIDTIRKVKKTDDKGCFGSVTYFALHEPGETLIAVKVRIDCKAISNYDQEYF